MQQRTSEGRRQGERFETMISLGLVNSIIFFIRRFLVNPSYSMHHYWAQSNDDVTEPRKFCPCDA